MFKEFNVQFQDVEMLDNANDLLKDTKVTKVSFKGENKMKSLDSTFENCGELDTVEGNIDLKNINDINEILKDTPLVREVSFKNINSDTITATNSLNDVEVINIDGTETTRDGVQSFLSNLEWDKKRHNYVGDMTNRVVTLSEELTPIGADTIQIVNAVERSTTNVEIEGQTLQNLIDGKREETVKDEWTFIVNQGSGEKDVAIESTGNLSEINGQTYQNLISNSQEEKVLVNAFEMDVTTNHDSFNGGLEVYPNEIRGNTIQGLPNAVSNKQICDAINNNTDIHGATATYNSSTDTFTPSANDIWSYATQLQSADKTNWLKLKPDTVYTVLQVKNGSPVTNTLRIVMPEKYEYTGGDRSVFRTDSTGLTLLYPSSYVNSQGELRVIEGDVRVSWDYDLNYIESVGEEVNLAKVSEFDVNNGGINFKCLEDGTIVAKGTSTGYCWVNIADGSYSANEIGVIETTYDGTLKSKTLVEGEGTYTIKAFLEGACSNAFTVNVIYDDTKAISLYNTNTRTITVSTKINAITVQAWHENNTVDMEVKVQLEKGSVATDYVPYGRRRIEVESTNCINLITDDATVIDDSLGMYWYGLEVIGEDIKITGNNGRISLAYKHKNLSLPANRQITFSYKEIQIQSTVSGLEVSDYRVDFHYIDGTSASTGRVPVVTFTPTKVVDYIGVEIFLTKDYANGDIITLKNPQINFGNGRIEKQSNKTSFVLSQSLKKIGDYADRLYWDEDKGHYCIEQNIAEVPLKNYLDDNRWGINPNHTTEELITFEGIRLNDLNITLSSKTAMLKGFRWITQYNASTEGIGGSETYAFIRISKAKLTSADVYGFEEWIKKENPIIYSAYKTPIIIDLPQYNQKEFLQTYSTTYIDVNGETYPSSIKVQTDMWKKEAKILPNTQYTLIADIDRDSATTDVFYDLGGKTGTISSMDGYRNVVTSITTPSTLGNTTLVLSGRYNKVKNVMLFKGSMQEKLEYFDDMQSFGELQNDGKYKVEIIVQGDSRLNTKTFYLDQPLRKISDDVIDRLYYDYDKGKYFVERNIGVVELDEFIINGFDKGNFAIQEKVVLAISTIEGTSEIMEELKKRYLPVNSKTYVVQCNTLPHVGTYAVHWQTTYPSIGYGFDDTKVGGAISFIEVKLPLKYNTKEKVKQFFRDNPTYFLVHLSAPIIEELENTDSKINVYPPTTHVSTNSIVKPSTIKMESKPVIYEVELQPSTEYQVVFDVESGLTASSIKINLGGAVKEIPTSNQYTNKIVLITTPATISENTLKIINDNHKIKNVMLIQGGQVQELDYFDGIQNLGKLQKNGKYEVGVKSWCKEDEVYEGNIIIENTDGSESFTLEEIAGNTWQNPNDLSIVSVGELQEDGNYKIDIESVGENLFNTSSESVVNSPSGNYGNKQKVEFTGNGNEIVLVTSDAGQATEFDVEFKAGVTYTISFDIITEASDFYGTIAFCKKGATWEEIGSVRQNILPAWSTEYQHFTKTFTPDSDCVLYLGGGQWGYRRGTRTTLKNIMITTGDSECEYVPYSKNITSIVLPQPLMKIGGSCDRLYWDEDKGHYCIEQNNNTFITSPNTDSGNTNVANSIGFPSGYDMYFQTSDGDKDSHVIMIDGCSNIGWNSTSGSLVNVAYIRTYTHGYIRIGWHEDSTLTSEEKYACLRNKRAYYRLSTPRVIDLPNLDEKITISGQLNKTHIQTSNLSATSMRAVASYGNFLTFMLDEPLSKVGDVADRLYWDETKGHYCIKKGYRQKTFNSSDGWVKAYMYAPGQGAWGYQVFVEGARSWGGIPTNNLSNANIGNGGNGSNITGMLFGDGDSTGAWLFLTIAKDTEGFTTGSLEELNAFFLANPLIIMFKSSTTIDLTEYTKPLKLFQKEVTKIKMESNIRPSKFKVDYIDII